MSEDIQSVREQLEANPEDSDARERLISLLLETNDLEGLVSVLNEQTQSMDEEEIRAHWKSTVKRLHEHFVSVEDQKKRSAIVLIIGRILDDELSAPDEAMAQYHAAHRLDPENAAALDAARDLAIRQQMWAQAFQLAALEARLAIQPERKLQLYLLMARICEDHLNRPSGAYRWASQVLGMDPNNEDALSVHQRLGEAGREKEARYLALVDEIRAVRDRRKRSAMMIERVSAWFDASPDDPWVEEVLWMVLNQDPRNTTARALLDEFYEANNRWLELSRYLAERVKKYPEEKRSPRFVSASRRVVSLQPKG